MYGCECWNIKKAECQRIDAFELWCWRRLLRVPWTERRPNQSTLNEISPEYSLEGLMLKLKLQYFGHLMQRPYSFQPCLTYNLLNKPKQPCFPTKYIHYHPNISSHFSLWFHLSYCLFSWKDHFILLYLFQAISTSKLWQCTFSLRKVLNSAHYDLFVKLPCM